MQTKQNNKKADKEKKVKEQEDILNCDKSVIVSASAGSGKTTIMIKKVFSLLKDKKCNIDELLVLTYTNLAAAEMKKKLIDKLKDNLKDNPNLIEIIEQIPNSDISTFDSFCQKLVKKYFYYLEIDPSFSVLQGGDEEYQKELAMVDAISDMKINHTQNYETLLNSYSKKRDENDIKNVINKIYNYAISILDIEDFFKKTLNFYKKDEKIAENYLISYYNQIFWQIKNQLNEKLVYCNTCGFTKYSIYINNLLSITEKFILSNDFLKMIDLSKDVDYGTLREEKQDTQGLINEIKEIKTKLQKTIKEISSYQDKQTINQMYDDCGVLINCIIDLEKLFIEKYSALKKEKNIFDFNDIERLTIKLLQNPEICDEIKDTYKYVFVDEFQDANAVQEKIINLIDSPNVFFVGDTKQSIYAFRQSDPEIFLKIQKQFKENTNAESLPLNCNFRTNKNILEFVNQIFSTLMTEGTSKINYKKDAQFNPMADYKELKNEINVSLNLINQEKEEEVTTAKEVYDISKHFNKSSDNNFKKQCVFICNTIASLLGEKIYDKEEEIWRKVKLEDITILFSKKSKFLNQLISTLAEYNIPFMIDKDSLLENEYDCRILFGLISLAINSKDDYSLYKVLTSCLFDFNDDELAQIRLSGKKKYFYEQLEDYSKNKNQIADKIKYFYKMLSEFSFNAKYMGIFFALNKIINSTNYLLKIKDEKDFDIRKSNIEEYMSSFVDSKYNYDMLGYILYRQYANRQDTAKTKSSQDNSINIVTMHSSKGLEYPIVILPNLDQDFTKNREYKEIKIDKEFGIGIKAYNEDDRTVEDGMFYDCCKKKSKQLELSEKIRLLYVATTRAKNRLILIGNNKQNYKKFKTDYEIMSQNNYLSMIIGCLDDDVIQKINLGEEYDGILFNNLHLKLNIYKDIQLLTNQNNVQTPIFNDKENQQKLYDYLSYDLSKNKVNIALKNSVSGFAFEDSSINFAPEKLNISEHLLETTTQLGTLYHKLLETVDFNNINSVDDVLQFIDCNFAEEDKQVLKQIPIENMFKNILLLKQISAGATKVLKEQKFVMKIKHSDLVDGGFDNRILVQGIVDFLAIYKDRILLVDYKLTHKQNKEIIEKYKKQLEIYKMAISKQFKNIKICSKILNLYKNEFIDI